MVCAPFRPTIDSPHKLACPPFLKIVQTSWLICALQTLRRLLRVESIVRGSALAVVARVRSMSTPKPILEIEAFGWLGGWLALLTGMGIGFEACGLKTPAPPTSIAAMYPITDLNDPFWHTKQHPVSYWPRVIPAEEMTEHLDPKAPVLFESALDSKRAQCYPYMLQEWEQFYTLRRSNRKI